jgi:hypothetical protein
MGFNRDRRPSGLPALSAAESTAAPMPWDATGLLCRECHGYSTDLYKLYSAKGWNREEPLDQEWPISEPRSLANAMNLIADSGVRTKADLLAVEFTMSARDVENLISLPPG